LKHKIKVIILILVTSLLTSILIGLSLKTPRNENDVFVGVEFAYGDMQDCKRLVDEVKEYTNLFVIGLPECSLNQTLLNSISDYVYNAGLHFIVFFTSPSKYPYDPYMWIRNATKRYGEKFLGVYRIDEPGGKQLDNKTVAFVQEAENYTDAAAKYVEGLYLHIDAYLEASPRLFTADYALYWFDYKAGYTAILTEFGWNNSRALNVAQCRGAAEMHGKEWGVMVTWTFTEPPYLEDAEALYADMVTAYHAGAKYIVIFSYPKITEYGTLTKEHLEAMKKFWQYTRTTPRKTGFELSVAYVLPNGYGFGFRSPNDTIWGLWPPDSLTTKIWHDVSMLIEKYGCRVDIVYDETENTATIAKTYTVRLYWNETLPKD